MAFCHIGSSAPYALSVVDSGNEFLRFCTLGDFEKVKSLLEEGVNVYKPTDYNFAPLSLAFGNENLVNLLLDVYELDLEALNGTHSKRVLIALPDDQTEEFWETVENELSQENLIPVFVKDKRNVTVKRVYLRRQLKDKDDLSFEISKTLEMKNGACDLNWRYSLEDPEDSFLHRAIIHQMRNVVKRLLNHSTTDVHVKNRFGQTPLHYALHAGSLELVSIWKDDPGFEKIHEDPMCLYYASSSGKLKCLDFVIDLMLENGKSLEEILKIPFVVEDYRNKYDKYLFHVIASSGNFYYFLNEGKRNFSHQDLCIQTTHGETILHLLVYSYHLKIKEKIKIVSQFAEMCPKLLLIRNKYHRLPVHFAALQDIRGNKLFNHLLKLTIKESGNPDILTENNELALSILEESIELNKGLSEDYLKTYDKILALNGPRLLQKAISSCKSLKSLKGLLSSSVKVNPNEVYDGTNSFLTMIRFDINNNLCQKPNCATFERLKMLTDYHPIQDINARDETGTTLFMYIVGSCEHNDYIKSLMNSGADCHAQNNDCMTCLHYAAKNSKNHEIVRTLLDKGVDSLVHSKTGKLAIHYAITNENINAFEILLPLLSADELSQKLSDKDETLIQFTTHEYNQDILKAVWEIYEMYDVKIDVNQTNCDGDNLPMIALKTFNPQHIQLIFLKAFQHINFDLQNNLGESFTHNFSDAQQMLRFSEIFEKFPKLKEIVNKQINLTNLEASTPMDKLAVIFEEDSKVG